METLARLLAICLVVAAVGCDSKPVPPGAAPTATSGGPGSGGGDSLKTTAAPGPADAAKSATTGAAAADPEKMPPAKDPPAAAAAKTAEVKPALEAPIGQSWKDWAKALGDKDVQARAAAAQQLEQRGAVAVEQLVRLLKDSPPDVRRGAAFFLIDRFEPANAEMVAAFSAALSAEDPTLRHMALSAAGRFSRESLVEAAPQLAKMLASASESKVNRAAIARLLAGLEADARPVLPALTHALQADGEASVRTACLQAVTKIAPPAEAVATLRQVLSKDTDGTVRRLAAARLAALGPAAVSAAGELAGALSDKDRRVRAQAAESLVALGPGASAALAGQLAAEDVEVRRFAVGALGKIGPPAKPVLAELKKRLQDPDAEVQRLAGLAVQRIESGP